MPPGPDCVHPVGGDEHLLRQLNVRCGEAHDPALLVATNHLSRQAVRSSEEFGCPTCVPFPERLPDARGANRLPAPLQGSHHGDGNAELLCLGFEKSDGAGPILAEREVVPYEELPCADPPMEHLGDKIPGGSQREALSKRNNQGHVEAHLPHNLKFLGEGRQQVGRDVGL